LLFSGETEGQELFGLSMASASSSQIEPAVSWIHREGAGEGQWLVMELICETACTIDHRSLSGFQVSVN